MFKYIRQKNDLVPLIDYVLFCYTIVFNDDLINEINKYKKRIIDMKFLKTKDYNLTKDFILTAAATAFLYHTGDDKYKDSEKLSNEKKHIYDIYSKGGIILNNDAVDLMKYMYTNYPDITVNEKKKLKGFINRTENSTYCTHKDYIEMIYHALQTASKSYNRHANGTERILIISKIMKLYNVHKLNK